MQDTSSVSGQPDERNRHPRVTQINLYHDISGCVRRLQIMHTCLNVMDLERSIAFYRDLLGLKLTRRFEVRENNAEVAFLEDPNGSAIELTHWRDKKQLLEGDSFDHIAFGVKELKATIAHLRAHGVTIAMEPFKLKGGAHQIAFIKDPDGNWLELIEE